MRPGFASKFSAIFAALISGRPCRWSQASICQAGLFETLIVCYALAKLKMIQVLGPKAAQRVGHRAAVKGPSGLPLGSAAQGHRGVEVLKILRGRRETADESNEWSGRGQASLGSPFLLDREQLSFDVGLHP
jgi:hypothetical protein